MSTKDQTDLVKQVLVNLGAIGEDQPPETSQINRVNEKLPGAIETLRSTEVFYLGDIDQIPLDAFNPLADVIAWECRTAFGIVGDELIALGSKNTDAVKALRVMRRGRPTYQPLVTEFL